MISTTLVTPLINLFKVCPIAKTSLSDLDKLKIFTDALKKGYLIDIHAINEYSLDFISSVDMKYNSTFYKTWNDVISKDRFELLIDQLTHYFTVAYCEDAYLPNTEPNEPVWTEYTTIDRCTFDDLYAKCIEMLQSGIALKSETVKILTNFVITYAKQELIEVDIDSINNREAITIICDALNILPKRGDKLFAYIIYKCCGETMIIKNRILRRKIRENRDKVEGGIAHLNENQLIALSKVFNRYKPLFVALKTNISRKNINKISRLSKVHHKSFKRGILENVLNCKVEDLDVLKEAVKTVNNYKLITILQAIRERVLRIADNVDSIYIIRNEKIFVKENSYTLDGTCYDKIYDICLNQLKENLSKKACKIKFPKYLDYACPTSEKNFIGDIPMGSNCTLTKNSVIGIYWKNEWGSKDLDLSVTTIAGERIGWNSYYYNDNQNIIYSGDIVDAPNGANEAMFFGTDDIPDLLVNVNRYNGISGSKYKMFFGMDKKSSFKRRKFDNSNYMTNPNEVLLNATITQNDAREQMVGTIFDNKFSFFSLSTGYGQVANAVYKKEQSKDKKLNNCLMDNKKAYESYLKVLKCKVNSFVMVKPILLAAGFEEVDENPDIDLTKLDRSTLISIFDK